MNAQTEQYEVSNHRLSNTPHVMDDGFVLNRHTVSVTKYKLNSLNTI